MTNNKVLLHLSLITALGPTGAFKILRFLHQETFPDVMHVGWPEIFHHKDQLNLLRIYDYTLGDLVKSIGLSEKTAESVLAELVVSSWLDQELELLQKHPVRYLTILDDEYPEILKQINTPPLVLYCQGGSFNSHIKRMGMVGSRKATDYAYQTVQNLVPTLVQHDWCIVSGGAEGADTMAHEAALQAGGKTVAVIGSGLLQPYPTSNLKLFDRIVQSGGMMVSPFPLMMRPDKSTFPARNRIIAGLSQGCVILQAAAKSGALITANFALEQGRHVFAVPGSIYEDLSAGCHNLIQQGAKLVHHAGDILEEFGLIMTRQEKEKFRGAVQAQHLQETITDQGLMKYLSIPSSVDDLMELTSQSYQEINDQLFTLQLEGKVQQDFTGKWVKVLL